MHHHTRDVREAPVSKNMTRRVFTVHKDTSIQELLKLFDEHDVSDFPVVDDEGNFIGDIHERDLLKLAVEPQYLDEHRLIGIFGTKLDESFFAESVEDLMKEHDVTVSPDTSTEDAVLEMWKEGLRSIPVVEKGKLVGIISEADVIDKVVTKLKHVKLRKKKKKK